jgi:hypothetical protein
MGNGCKLMILVSFSLYGSDPKYIIGALRNAELIRSFGSGWQSVFYLGSEISEETRSGLLVNGAKIRSWDESWHKNGMFWRFAAIHDFHYDFLIFRDVDSRISERELAALGQWFKSGKTLHVMRDHPYHNALILGGMWGVTSAVKRSKIKWNSAEKYGVMHGQDQVFLHREIYPHLKMSKHVNDEFFSLPFNKFRFPTDRSGLSYVGETLDENDHFDEGLRLVLDKFIHSPTRRFKLFAIFLLHRFHKST